MLYFISIIIPLLWLYLCDFLSNFNKKRNNSSKYINVELYFNKYYNTYQICVFTVLVVIILFMIFGCLFISKTLSTYLLLLYSYIMMVDTLLFTYSKKVIDGVVFSKLALNILLIYVSAIMLLS